MAYGNIPYISLPQLNTQGPDIMGTMATLENIKANKQRMGLAEISAQREQEQFDWQKKKYEEDRPLEKQSKILDMLHKTASVAVLAKNQDGANKIWEQGVKSIKAVDPNFEVGEVPIQFKGDKVKQKLEDGSSIEGNQDEVFKFLQFRRAQKEKGVNITGDQFSELATSLKLNFEMPSSKPPDMGKTRTIQKGSEEVTQEWTGKEWEEIGRGSKWKPDTEEEKGSDFNKAFKKWSAKPENAGKPAEEFKRVWEKPSDDHIKLLETAATAVGVDPKKAAKGEITQEEASKILERYAKDNGIVGLMKALGAMGGGEPSGEVKFDSSGKRVK
jgi:hypothetical protein